MSIRISKNIDDNSIKYSNGLQSMEALIGSMVSSINEPVKHKCKKVRRYMRNKCTKLSALTSDLY